MDAKIPHNSYKWGGEGPGWRSLEAPSHLHAGGVAGPGRQSSSAMQPPAPQSGPGRISRRPGASRFPEAGEGRRSRPGRANPEGEPVSGRARISGAGGSAGNVGDAEHVQFAPHPYYG